MSHTSSTFLVSKVLKAGFLSAVLVTSSVGLTGCGYNKLQAQDESIDGAWSEVMNQYQRRADLVPNLVAITEKYAEQEQEVLTEVANARAKVGTMQMTQEALKDPVAMQNFQQAQSEMKGSLSRLIAVSESYPDLKADALFLDLSAQLEGTENRIAVARKRYIDEVKTYNTTVRQFPSNITAKMFGMDKKPQFSVENEAAVSQAPKVEFSQ